MRPCGSHRPPLRFSNLASSASSSFIFRFLRDGDVGVCSPSRRVFLIAVPLVMKRAHSTSPKAHKKGDGGGLQFRAFPSWVSSFSCLRSSYVGVCTGLLFLLVFISQIVVGTPTEGDMARFRLRFRGCLRVPHQNRPTQKVQISSFYDPVLYAKTRQDQMYIRQPVFSHLLWFQSCRCLVLSLHIYFFDINQFTCDVCLVSKLV